MRTNTMHDPDTTPLPMHRLTLWTNETDQPIPKKPPDPLFYFEILLYITLTAMAVSALVYWAVNMMRGPVLGAPAPFKPRPARAKSLPVSCVMVWCGTNYQTRFAPDGQYEAVHPGGCSYSGIWWIRRIDGRDVLHIHETLAGSSDYFTYRVWLDSDWRSGRIGQDGGGFRLDE